jgi:hypothetical protein
MAVVASGILRKKLAGMDKGGACSRLRPISELLASNLKHKE